jgi:hypothetical protein
MVFKQGGVQQLKLQLLFDTFAEQTDVRQHTDLIWKMMAVDDSSENARSGKGAPPLVAFEWGGLHFEAVLTAISQKFVLFLPDGTPVRTTVDITLEQTEVPDDYQPQQPGASPAQTPLVVTPTQGQRMDTIAAQQTGDPANQRSIAEQNNIDNPRRPPRQVVTPR